MRVPVRRTDDVKADRARRHGVRVIRRTLGIESRLIETFGDAAEVLRGARVLVHQRAERTRQPGMTDKRGCHMPLYSARMLTRRCPKCGRTGQKPPKRKHFWFA